MTTTHAWFSAETALLRGCDQYRKTGGSIVNVTRVNPDKDAKGSFRQDEKYLGEVISEADGGRLGQTTRRKGITG
jgi:hypothetical protein